MTPEIRLSDLYVLGALRVKGFRPLRAEPDGHRTAWVFADSPEVRKAIADFYSGQLAVDAQAYGEAVRSLKGEAIHFRDAIGVG